MEQRSDAVGVSVAPDGVHEHHVEVGLDPRKDIADDRGSEVLDDTFG